jgi:hypothetical protein
MAELLGSTNISVQTLTRIIEAGQQAGEICEGDPAGMSVAFFAAIQGLAVYKLTMSGFRMPDPEILVNMMKK